MIISTRYRDIPYDEARRCWNPLIREWLTRQMWESSIRGKPVMIETESVAPNEQDTCSGPFFYIHDGRTAIRYKCCAHFVEIGDC